MCTPKISIIVPVYNAEKTLRRCVDSILAQSFTDFEVLLIDDGSKDDSLKICNEYVIKDERVHVFHKDNGGVSSARNCGIEHAVGEWITFADSDDSVGIEWLDIYSDYLHDFGCLIVQGLEYTLPDNREHYIHIGKKCIGKPVDVLPELQGFMFGSPVNKLFDSTIIRDNNLRFDSRFIFREDEDFLLKYCGFVSMIISVSAGSYKYEAPNMSEKYQTDNFYSSCSMYRSLQKIYGGEENGMTYDYLLSMTNAYFNSFDMRLGNYTSRTIEFLETIKYNVPSLPISTFSKMVFNNCKHPRVIAGFFYLKSVIHNILTR